MLYPKGNKPMHLASPLTGVSGDAKKDTHVVMVADQRLACVVVAQCRIISLLLCRLSLLFSCLALNSLGFVR